MIFCFGIAEAAEDAAVDVQPDVFVETEVVSQGCFGSCGAQSSEGCYCDEACFGYGDCCENICEACPDLACCDKQNLCTDKECGDDGCGGTCGECTEGKTCVQNKCVAGQYPEVCLGMNTPSGTDCAGVTFEGCCDDKGRVVFCDDKKLYCIDCSKGPECGWNAQASYYDCGTEGGEDPSGKNPKNCNFQPVEPVPDEPKDVIEEVHQDTVQETVQEVVQDTTVSDDSKDVVTPPDEGKDTVASDTTVKDTTVTDAVDKETSQEVAQDDTATSDTAVSDTGTTGKKGGGCSQSGNPSFAAFALVILASVAATLIRRKRSAV